MFQAKSIEVRESVSRSHDPDQIFADAVGSEIPRTRDDCRAAGMTTKHLQAVTNHEMIKYQHTPLQSLSSFRPDL
jgi:hypothetical protein